MPFIRRRPLLRAAVVGGGAYAMGKHTANAQAERQEEAYNQGQYDQAAAAPPPAAPPPAASAGPSSDDITRLTELGRLHEQGILTDEEFASQKAKILGL